MALQIERVLDSFFKFSLNGGTPIIDASPTVTFDGNLCNFKTKNGASIIKEQKIIVSDVTVVDTFGGSGSFTYNNVPSLIEKLAALNFFQDRVTANAGSTSFNTLLDTFTYFGNNGKVPIVDEQQQKLIPTDFYNLNKLTQMSDVAISSLTSGKYLKVEMVQGVPKVVLADIISKSTASGFKKIEYIAQEGDTEITVDNSPVGIFLYKNGSWLIENRDFTYIGGLISLIKLSADGINYEPSPAYENDYFEVIPLANNVKKQTITATQNNQAEFNFDGNPAFADVYLKGTRLREGVDYTRTLFSGNNKIIIINQYFIDDIQTGDILELITY